VDAEVFFPLEENERRHMRAKIEGDLGLDSSAFRVISVGRLDWQKDPDLLLSAVGRVAASGAKIELLFVGDGVLRDGLERRVAEEGLAGKVRFLGLRGATEIAGLLQASDCFALSSAYEGMPMAMLEALASGIPVVATPVGEVRRVIQNGRNGEVSNDRSLQSFGEELERVRANLTHYSVDICVRSIESYVPAKVLEPVYQNYRRIRMQ
jgi:glycosyltransferase involved in cell wall biosynthesis